jgi:SSS family solute:Na+ symporter
MVGGLAVCFGWRLLGSPAGIDPVVPGFLTSLILMVLVSLLTPPPPREALEPYFDPEAEVLRPAPAVTS